MSLTCLVLPENICFVIELFPFIPVVLWPVPLVPDLRLVGVDVSVGVSEDYVLLLVAVEVADDDGCLDVHILVKRHLPHGFPAFPVNDEDGFVVARVLSSIGHVLDITVVTLSTLHLDVAFKVASSDRVGVKPLLELFLVVPLDDGISDASNGLQVVTGVPFIVLELWPGVVHVTCGSRAVSGRRRYPAVFAVHEEHGGW